jgi:hypothetical protein
MSSRNVTIVASALTLAAAALGLRALAAPSPELPAPRAERSTTVQVPKTPARVPAAERFVGLGISMQPEPGLVSAGTAYLQLWDYAEFELLAVMHWQNLHEPFFPQLDLWGNDDGSVYNSQGKVVPARFPWKHPLVAERMAPYYELLGHAAERGQKILLNNVAAGFPGWMGDGLGLYGEVRNKRCLSRARLQAEYSGLLDQGLSPDQARHQIQQTLFGGINDHPCTTREDGDEFAENLGEFVRHLVQDEGLYGQVQKRKLPVHALSIWLEPRRSYEVYFDQPNYRPESHYPKKFVALFAAVDKYLRGIGLRGQVRLAAGSDHDIYPKIVIRQITDPVAVRSTDIVDLHHYTVPISKFSFIDQIGEQTDKPLYMFEAGGSNLLWKTPRPLTPEEIFLWSLDSVRVLVEGLNRGVKAVCLYFWAHRGRDANERAMQAIDVDTVLPQPPYYSYCLASKTTLGNSIVLKPAISNTFQGDFSAVGLRKGQAFTALMVNRGPATAVTLSFGDSLGAAPFHVYAVSAASYNRISDLGTVTPQGSSLGVIEVPADSVVSVTTLLIDQLSAPVVPDVSGLGLLVLLGLFSAALRRRTVRT